MHKKTLLFLTLFFALIGILDAGYLTMEHYSNTIPPCEIGAFADCGKVLKSIYAMIGPIPVAVLGLTYYTSLFFLIITRLSLVRSLSFREKIWEKVQSIVRITKKWELGVFLQNLQLVMTISGVLFSVYFVYLQLFIIQAICIYCMVSAINSVILFVLSLLERKN